VVSDEHRRYRRDDRNLDDERRQKELFLHSGFRITAGRRGVKL
jgi:hypothetical protein